jgi:hypothetical protein
VETVSFKITVWVAEGPNTVTAIADNVALGIVVGSVMHRSTIDTVKVSVGGMTVGSTVLVTSRVTVKVVAVVGAVIVITPVEAAIEIYADAEAGVVAIT